MRSAKHPTVAVECTEHVTILAQLSFFWGDTRVLLHAPSYAQPARLACRGVHGRSVGLACPFQVYYVLGHVRAAFTLRRHALCKSQHRVSSGTSCCMGTQGTFSHIPHRVHYDDAYLYLAKSVSVPATGRA